MTRTMRRLDEALPSGPVEASDFAGLWVNTDGAAQGFRWLATERDETSGALSLRAGCAGSGTALSWPPGSDVTLCGGISTSRLTAFSARRAFAGGEVLLQGNFNLGLLVLATFQSSPGDSPGYFSREFFARRAALPEPAETSGEGLFSHVEPPESVDTSAVLGRWRNADAQARGLVELTVEKRGGGLAVGALGSGEAGPADWGEAGEVGVFACLDETGRPSLSVLAGWDFGFLATQLQLRVPAGTLAVAGFNTFRDTSGRPSYSTREFFYSG